MTDVLIVGTGPAALIAADFLSRAGRSVKIFERRPSAGWKLLVAGSSGLNVSHAGEDLAQSFTERSQEMKKCLEVFSREDWLAYLESLKEPTFLGTSKRYFLENKKATGLLKTWVEKLQNQKVEFFFEEEMESFSSSEVKFQSGRTEPFRFLLLALGGASWEKQLPSWPEAFRKNSLQVTPFAPENAGFEFKVSPDFFTSAEGLPIKGFKLKTAKGEKIGECMITRYGLEGTPIYSMGCPGPAEVDLKPDLELAKLQQKIQAVGVKKWKLAAKLSPGAELLFAALAPEGAMNSAETLAKSLKSLPLELLRPRGLEECISSSGGLSWEELQPDLSLKKMPSVFCAGEMVDWSAPTGGFLLQGSVSMGVVAAKGILKKLE